jgi:hypothetical protein
VGYTASPPAPLAAREPSSIRMYEMIVIKDTRNEVLNFLSLANRKYPAATENTKIPKINTDAI